ncbi:hypothetical protein [Acanthopleuribacter pedis]|uniref:Uncharacterized protein n=1 Tax=Acanthopleuribacter pedis TaxID=442870 RepID=A0A8J7Q483_9BACT|nr:hypothetical protein [Acanthopleuribacter pedis]MBO1317949.1 hypothetical protein [Acanthopleuribacter pedis]
MSVLTQPIHDFLAYLDRIAPGYQDELAGDALYILRLNRVHENAELPPLYESFLRVMGTSVGASLFHDLNLNAADIINWYHGVYPTLWPVGDNYHLLAFPKQDEMHWFMALDERVGKDDVMIFQAEGTQPLEDARKQNFCHYGFRDLLYFEAFTKLHMKRWNTPTQVLRQILPADETRVLHERLAATFAKAGFHEMGATSEYLDLYERDDCLVALQREVTRPGHLIVRLAGAEAKATEAFMHSLVDTYDLTIAQC